MAEKLKGVSQLPEYSQWSGMIARCTNPRSPSWRRYGGAGITVAPEWLGHAGLMRFRAHIGPRPTPKHQIDRVDGRRGYAPGNVRWATSQEQNRNKSSNQFLTFGGETLCHSQWAERLGISRQSLSARLRKWPLEKALSEAASVRGYRPARLSKRQIEVLEGLRSACGASGRWVRPQEIGGSRSENHNDVLRSLAEIGLTERKQNDGREVLGQRRIWLCRITPAGRLALEKTDDR